MHELRTHEPPSWLPPTIGAKTIPEAVDRAAAWRADALAIVDTQRQVSYRALAVQMRRAAAGFVHMGLSPGDRVALWAPNGAEWIITALGIHAAGGIIVPVNTRFKGRETQHVISRSGARFLVHAARFLDTDYAAMLERLDMPTLEYKVSLSTPEAPEGTFATICESAIAESSCVAEVERRMRALAANSVADIMYTSGTTGAPKGAVATHEQNIRISHAWLGATTLCDTDRFLLLWPFFHCSGYKAGWLASLLAGATVYPEPTLDVARLIARVVRERISFMPGPPTLFQSLLASPEGRSGKFRGILRVSCTGATTVAPELITSIHRELGVSVVFNGYGLTETCGIVTMTAATDPPEIVVSSVGKPMPGVDVQVMNSDGIILAPGIEGEIVVRGYNVMQGYFDDPQGTAEALDTDGWLHTGDLGTVDTAGYLRITGRIKDIFIVGGFNCYPAEIENIIQRHPAVAEVAVVGFPDERLGEVGKAFVVTTAGGASFDSAELIAWCRENMANYKVPRHVVILDRLPRTSTGKIQKFRLVAGEFG